METIDIANVKRKFSTTNAQHVMSALSLPVFRSLPKIYIHLSFVVPEKRHHYCSDTLPCSLITTRKCGVITFSVAHVCQYVCLSVMLQLLKASKVHFWYTGTSAEYFGWVRFIYIKVIGSRSRLQEQKHVYVSCSLRFCIRLKGSRVVLVTQLLTYLPNE